MKKFLKSKSGKGDGGVEADRNALFGNRTAAPARRPSTDSTASRDTQLPAYQDPYADTSAAGQRPDPYLKRSTSRPQPASNNSYANDPYASPADPYATRRGAGSSARDRDGGSVQQQREELFRGAQPDRRLDPSSNGRSGRAVQDDDAYGASEGQEGEQVQDDEDEEVEGIRQEIRFVKQESLSSTRNALRLANEAEESGRSTLTKLGEQSESLANAEQSIDLSALANRDAQVKARELKNLNRSMFAIQVNKPWGKNKRIEADELRVRQQYEDDRYDRDAREQVRKEAERRTDANLKAHAELQAKGTTRRRAGLAERSRYQFDPTESDDEAEEEIDKNLDALSAVTGRLKGLAMATNTEVTRQNEQLARLDRKGDDVGVGIHMNTHRLKRIGERG